MESSTFEFGALNQGNQIGNNSGNIYFTNPSSQGNNTYDLRKLRELLPCVKNAIFNSNSIESPSFCHPKTRVQVLENIHQWIHGDEGHIFWLKGLAGSGKSTIARTIAQDCSNSQTGCESLWVATFFFSDKVRSADQLVTSIAHQLITHPPYGEILGETLWRDSGALGILLPDQWMRMIWGPLSKMKTKLLTLVIVIDALDECEEQEKLTQFLRRVEENSQTGQVRLRLLVTSRMMVLDYFTRQISHCALQDIPVHEDIRIFLNNTLKKGNVACDKQIDDLVRMSGGLFLWAETARRYITKGPKHTLMKRDRLEEILADHRDSETRKALDSIYCTVLESPLRDSEKTMEKEKDSRKFRRKVEVCTSIKRLLGDIVVLFSPLSPKSLGGLISQSPSNIRATLQDYRAIIDIPEDDSRPLRMHHACFGEFLFDEQRSGSGKINFHVNSQQAHREMTTHCMRVMRGMLRQNICGCACLCASITEMKEENIASEINYACRHWTKHLRQSKSMAIKSADVLSFLKAHFIHWLEAMSILRRISEVVRSIKYLHSFSHAEANVELSDFLCDAKRFIFRNRQLAETAPLQLYTSGIIFCPKSSVIKRIFGSDGTYYKLRPVEKAWNPELQVLEGHRNGVNSIHFSSGHDTPLLVSGSCDGTVSLWDSDTGELRWIHKGRPRQVNSINSVAFSHDSKLFASGSHDKTIVLRSVGTGKIRRILRGHKGWILSVAFSFNPQHQLLASGSQDRSVRIWDYNTGKLSYVLSGHNGQINSVAFSPYPKSHLLASASHDKNIILWDYVTGKRVKTLGHSSSITCLAFLLKSDTELIVSGSRDKNLQIWDYKSGEKQILYGHNDQVNSISCSRNPLSPILASGSRDKSIKIWNYSTRQLLWTINGHSEQVKSVAFSSDPDSNLLASSSDGCSIKLWDISMTGLEQFSQRRGSGNPSALVFSDNGEMVASCFGGQDVKIWGSSTGTLLRTLEKHSDKVECLAFLPLPHCQILASGSRDKTIRIWDLKTVTPYEPLKGHFDTVTSVAFSPDGRLLASGSCDKTVRTWDINTCKEIRKMMGHCAQINTITFSQSGHILASGSDDRTVRVWDCNTGKPIYTLRGHLKAVISIGLSPDGQILASGSGDGAIKLWDTKTGELRKTLEGHLGPIKSVAFSPDGSLLASTSYDRTAKIWGPISNVWQHLETLRGHSSFVWSERNFGVSIQDSQWIYYHGERRLWLPAEYRRARLALNGSVLCLSNSYGRVSFISM